MAIRPVSTNYTSSMYGVRPKSILKDTTSDATGHSTGSMWKKVCFDDVHIREYGFILGDNPAVSKGAPLQIDWVHHNEDVIDVDIFEHCREPVRRHRKKIVLSARKRAKILLSAGHTVEEIADMTLQCQLAKKQRVDSVKQAGGWELGNLNVNLADFMSGTAEVTGRTLKMVGLDAMGKAGLDITKATGKIVLGTGKLGVGIVLGTGKVASDVVVGTVVGTGRVATDVVVGTGKVGMEVVKGTGKVMVGTGKLGKDVVMGTGQLLKTGTETFARGSVSVVGGGLKGIGKAGRRITNIFSQGELIQEDKLKDGKAHLRHVHSASMIAGSDRRMAASAQNSPTQKRSHSSRRNTEMIRRGLSPLRADSRLLNTSNASLMDDERAGIGELDEMERFMKHLQDMDADQIERVFSKAS